MDQSEQKQDPDDDVLLGEGEERARRVNSRVAAARSVVVGDPELRCAPRAAVGRKVLRCAEWTRCVVLWVSNKRERVCVCVSQIEKKEE